MGKIYLGYYENIGFTSCFDNMCESTMLYWIAVVLMTFVVEWRLISFRELAKDIIYKIIMPWLEGDLEEWQTQEVNVIRGEACQEINVTRGFVSGDIDLLG